MLGDQPALTPQQAAYQRMLTGDPIEAIEQAQPFLKEGSVEAYHEEIMLGALRLAAADAALGRLDDKRLENIHQTVLEIVEDLGSNQVHSDEKDPGEEPTEGKVVDIEARKLGPTVFCISGLGRLDDCAAVTLADSLKRRGVVARTAAAATAIENDAAEIICVCFLEDVTQRELILRLGNFPRQAPSAKVIVCPLADASNEGDDRHPNDAPRSLAAVLAAIDSIHHPSLPAGTIDLTKSLGCSVSGEIEYAEERQSVSRRTQAGNRGNPRGSHSNR